MSLPVFSFFPPCLSNSNLQTIGSCVPCELEFFWSFPCRASWPSTALSFGETLSTTPWSSSSGFWTEFTKTPITAPTTTTTAATRPKPPSRWASNECVSNETCWKLLQLLHKVSYLERRCFSPLFSFFHNMKRSVIRERLSVQRRVNVQDYSSRADKVHTDSQTSSKQSQTPRYF